MSIESKLTTKQLIFCKEYLIDYNATRSATVAGYSEKTADSQGSRMLKNVKIKTYLDEMTTQRAERLDVSADKILIEITKVAYVDIEDTETEVKPSDKLKALDMLGKHVGLYERDNEQSKTKVEVKTGVNELYKAINGN